MKNSIIVNLCFWLASIGFPIVARSLPTGSGAPPKIYELLIPLIQILLACGSTFLLSKAINGKSGS